MLAALGASPAEDRVYGLLVTAVSACEEEIADGTALSQDEVRTALVSLIDRGLVDRMAETPTRFVAASPSVVESMIVKRLAELRAAQQTLDGLAAQYRAKSLARTADGVFEIIRGEDALRHCSLGLLRSARSEVLNLVKPPLIALQVEEEHRRLQAIDASHHPFPSRTDGSRRRARPMHGEAEKRGVSQV
jgi:sugar-specific transcriptional regulator TrmB